MEKRVHVLRYLWEVRRHLPGSRKQKIQILSRVKNSVREFAYENPCVNYSTIIARFGTPERIAESSVAEMETAELLQMMQIRQKILHITVFALTMLMVIWFGFHTVAYIDHTKDMRGYAVVEIIEDDGTTFDEGGN